jgi:hypothetical protein
MAVRHGLAGANLASPVEVATSVVALQSTDPASVFLSIRARSAGANAATIEKALYDDRTLLRMLGMRSTMFVVADDLAPIIQSSCTDAVAVTQRKHYIKLLTVTGVGDGAWLRELEEAALRVLGGEGRGDRSPALRRGATTADPGHGRRGQVVWRHAERDGGPRSSVGCQRE